MLGIVLLLFAILLTLVGILVILTVLWDLWLRIPFVRTPESVSRAMCDITPWTGTEKRVVDLGAGDGCLLEYIRRIHPDLRADGYEISPVVWMLGRLRTAIKHSGVHLYFHSLFHADLRDADVVYVYLLPELLDLVAPKLDRELKPGTPVISHAFRFRNRTPVKTVKVWKGTRETTVLLYRW